VPQRLKEAVRLILLCPHNHHNAFFDNSPALESHSKRGGHHQFPVLEGPQSRCQADSAVCHSQNDSFFEGALESTFGGNCASAHDQHDATSMSL
jgi:hypothetical protein